MQPSVDLLRAIPLLDGLDEAELRRLGSHAEFRTVAKGATLFREGEPPDCLFVLLKGLVELFTTRRKREAGVLIMWSGDTFMPAAALFDEPYLISARTLTDARLLAFDAARIREEVARCPRLALQCTQIVAGQFRMAVRHIKELKLRSAPERVGAFLLRLVNETGRQGCADLPLTKAHLALQLGMTAESLSRALQLLRAHGLQVRGSRIILSERAKLEAFVRPDPLIDGREVELGVAAL